MGDHVGIPGVVLLLLLLLPFILASAHAPADNTIHYILHYCTYYPRLSFLLLGHSLFQVAFGGLLSLQLRE